LRQAIYIAAALFSIAAPGAAFAQARECWNPHAGHYEGVRPGETQNDLDFRYCRPVHKGNGKPSWWNGPRECWNPRARHFERVRAGERQDDLDLSRCHPVASAPPPPIAKNRECWNPRAGHYERVRPGETQNDLDFSRCRKV